MITHKLILDILQARCYFALFPGHLLIRPPVCSHIYLLSQQTPAQCWDVLGSVPSGPEVVTVLAPYRVLVK